MASILKLYLASALVLTSTWVDLDRQRPITLAALLLLTLALDVRPGWFTPSAAHEPSARLIPSNSGRTPLLPPGFGWPSLLLGSMVCGPAMLALAAMPMEFPFGGDESYHFSAGRAYVLLLRQTLPPVCVLAAVLLFLTRLWKSFPWLSVFLLALLALSPLYDTPVVVARYPAAFYFVAAPLNVLSALGHWRAPYWANHITNALSLPVWLFVLRPLVIRKWPDWSILPMCAFLFFQAPVVFYFTGGSGIEPWALILLLVAFEVFLCRPPEAFWLSYLLVGCSLLFKEPAIVGFPFVWALATIHTTGFKDRLAHVAAGIVTVVPFALYLQVRQGSGIERTVGFASLSTAFGHERLAAWWSHYVQSFGEVGGAALVGVIAYGLVALWWRRRDRLLGPLNVALLLSAASFALLFFVDEQSQPYAGYSRFALYPLFALALLLLPVGQLLAHRRPLRLMLVTAIVGINVITLPRFLSALKSPYEINSAEWYRFPIYYPIRSLLEQLDSQSLRPAPASVRVMASGADLIVLPVAYPDLHARHSLVPAPVDPRDCSCRPDQAVLVGIEARRGFALPTPPDPAAESQTQACVDRVKASCELVLWASDSNGAPVGVLGAPQGH